jgi:hypothetical protein
MKKNFSLIIYVMLFILILSVPVYWFNYQGNGQVFSLEEQRKLAAFPTLADYKTAARQILKGDFKSSQDHIQSKFENAAADQFPLRLEWIEAGRLVERSLIRLAYSWLNDPAMPASISLPAMDVDPFYAMRDGSMLFNAPGKFYDQTKMDIDLRINNYKDMVTHFPNQHFYIFYVDQINNSAYHPLNSYFPEVNNGRSFQYFEENLPRGIELSKLMLTSYQDYEDFFYHSDHHWNIHGAWIGYDKVYKMLSPHYPEMGPELTLKGIIPVPGAKFLGSLARDTFYPIQRDGFEIADVDMPPYTLTMNSILTYQNTLADYMAEEADNPQRSKYFDYYGYFNGSYPPIREYSFDNAAPRNLLV